MSTYPSRRTTVVPSSIRSQTSRTSSSASAGQSQLAARVSAKRAELENLKQLKDLSGALATQMTALEEKLSTLRDGTEAVACVLANWESVLGAIGMASRGVENLNMSQEERQNGNADGNDGKELPVTLVRIPAGEQGDGAAEGS